jgi:Ice-binding-like
MNKFENITDETASHSTWLPNDGNQVAGYKPLMWSVTLLLAAIVAGCGGGDGTPGAGLGLGPTGGVCAGASCVNLGTAGNYVILAKTGVSTTGTTAVTGNVGLSPNARIGLTGWSETMDATNKFSTSTYVTGKLYAADYAPPTPTNLTTAVSNMEAAYTAANGMAPAGGGLTTACPGAGIMDGTVVPPLAAGVYTCAVNVTIPTDFTLNGTATDVWVFQITGTLTQDAATKVLLTGGALAKNVFWQVSGNVDIGTTSLMQGVILGKTLINLQTGATENGRLMAQAAVTLDANAVTVQ